MTETFESLADKVRKWADDRQILENSTAEAQLWKLEEERQETLAALGKCLEYRLMGERLPRLVPTEPGIELKDGFGDMLVCIINAAAIAGFDPVEALAQAYDQIKDRTGHLGADGIFYKDSA